MTKRKVLITGATGYVSGRMLDDLRERYDVVPLDVSDRNREGQKVDGVHVVDLIDPDRSQYEQHFEGVDTVIHLAHKSRSGNPIDHFFIEKQNVEMAYNVLRWRVRRGRAPGHCRHVEPRRGLVRAQLDPHPENGRGATLRLSAVR